MSDELGRAVLELRTDGAQFFADLSKAQAAGKDLGGTFDRTGQAAGRAGQQHQKLGGLTSDLGGRFGLVTKIAGAFGVALTLGGVVQGAKHLFEYAEEVHNIAQAMDMSVRAVQELGAAGKSVGIDMQTMASGVFQLSRRIAEGDTATVAAVQSLGLNVKELRTLAPDQIFDRIAAAIKRVANPLQQTRLATDLFGRGASQLMALIRSGVPEARQFAQQMGLVASDESIERVHELGEQFSTMLRRVKAGAVDALGWVLRLMNPGGEAGAGVPKTPPGPTAPMATHLTAMDRAAATLPQALAVLGQHAHGLQAVAVASHAVTQATTRQMTADDLLRNRIKALRDEALIPLTAADREHVRVLHEAGLGEAEIAKELDAPIQAVGKYVKVLQDGEQQQKAYKEALENVRAAAIPLTAAQQAETIALDNLSVSTADIAHKIGAKEVQVRKYLDAVKEQTRLEKIQQNAWANMQKASKAFTDDAFKALIDNTQTALDLDHQRLDGLETSNDRINEMMLSGTRLKLAQLERERLAEIKQAQHDYDINSDLYRQKVALIDEYYAYQVKVATDTADTLEERLAAQGVFTKQQLKTVAAKAWADYYQMVAEKGKWTTEQIRAQLAKARAATEATLSDLKLMWADASRQIAQSIWSAIGEMERLIPEAESEGEAIGQAAFKGFMAGMQSGNLIVAGLQAGLSALFAYIDSENSQVYAKAQALRDLSRQIQRDFPAQRVGQVTPIAAPFSTALVQKIQTAAVQLGRIGAEMKYFNEIIGEMGGLTRQNFGLLVARLSQIPQLVKLNQLTMADATNTLKTTFGQFADFIAAHGQVASQSFQDLVSWAVKAKLEVTEIDDWLVSQAKTIGAGLAAQLAPLTAKYADLTEKITDQKEAIQAQRDVIGEWNKQIGSPEVLKGLLEQNQAVKDAQKAVDDLVSTGKEGTDEYRLAVVNLTLAQQNQNEFSKDYQKELAKLLAEEAKLNGLLDEQAAGAAEAQASLDRVGLAALASYNAGIAKGMDQVALLDELAPALDNLVSLEETLGMASQNAAVQELIALRAKLSANKELALAATTWGQTYAAMVNLGVKDTDALSAMQQQGVANYDALIAKGLTESQALAQIKTGLQAVYDAHERLGSPIDENTQKLLDQAKAAGLITEASESLPDVFKTVGAEIVGAVKDLAAAIRGRLVPAVTAVGSAPTAGGAGELEGLWDSAGARVEPYHTGGVVSALNGGSYFGHLGRTIKAHHGLALGDVPLIGQTGEDIWSRQDVARWGGLAAVERMRTGGAIPVGGDEALARLDEIAAQLNEVKAAILEKDLSVNIQQAPGSTDTLVRRTLGPLTRAIQRNDPTDAGAGARTLLRQALGVKG